MPIIRRRNAVPGADRLGEGLRRFQLGRSRRGTEDCKSRVPQIVREAVHQWRFGTNNDESDPRLAAECSHLRMIVYVRGTVPRDGKDAGVPRRAVKSFELRTLPQFPGQGVFAAAAADKKHIHAYFLARKNGNGTGTLMPGWQSHPEAKLKTKIIGYEIISSETDKL
jgi:hypothetical protein